MMMMMMTTMVIGGSVPRLCGTVRPRFPVTVGASLTSDFNFMTEILMSTGMGPILWVLLYCINIFERIQQCIIFNHPKV